MLNLHKILNIYWSLRPRCLCLRIVLLNCMDAKGELYIKLPRLDIRHSPIYFERIGTTWIKTPFLKVPDGSWCILLFILRATKSIGKPESRRNSVANQTKAHRDSEKKISPSTIHIRNIQMLCMKCCTENKEHLPRPNFYSSLIQCFHDFLEIKYKL